MGTSTSVFQQEIKQARKAPKFLKIFSPLVRLDLQNIMLDQIKKKTLQKAFYSNMDLYSLA